MNNWITVYKAVDFKPRFGKPFDTELTNAINQFASIGWEFNSLKQIRPKPWLGLWGELSYVIIFQRPADRE